MGHDLIDKYQPKLEEMAENLDTHFAEQKEHLTEKKEEITTYLEEIDYDQKYADLKDVISGYLEDFDQAITEALDRLNEEEDEALGTPVLIEGELVLIEE